MEPDLQHEAAMEAELVGTEERGSRLGRRELFETLHTVSIAREVLFAAFKIMALRASFLAGATS